MALKKLVVAPGLKVELFASEPQLQNPVAFSIDEQGRFFVAESHRYKDSIFDITVHPPWLLEDLASRTVADRAAFLAKTFTTNLHTLTNYSEMIRQIEPDGKTSSVFAEGFNETVSGTAAGVMARHGEVWFTCIPDVWKFSAEKREKLFSGFGVHIGVSGHDLHGLRKGPDGKIYFSSGDRGFSVTNKEGKLLDSPDTGAVLRCNPDGSDLEFFCVGVRNPQDLTFDAYGNLWTDDNDTSGPDDSRLLYLVEDGDYGWRCSYQHQIDYGPWCEGDMWKGVIDGNLPYSGTVATGPAGMNFYPGTGLSPKYDNHFFVCDFPKGVWSFTVKPNGAGYLLDKKEEFLWHLGPTKIEFGPGGDAYVSDWGPTYTMPNAGRIYRVFDPTQQDDAARAEVKKLLADGMKQRSDAELGKLLEHVDMRVRLEAQWALADKGASSVDTFIAATKSTNQLARIHGIWGLQQLKLGSALVPLLDDGDSEIQAQAAKAIGNCPVVETAIPKLVALLTNANARVKFFAAQAIGKTGNKSQVPALFAMLKENNDKDAFLTHAGVAALVRINDLTAILAARQSPDEAVKRAALLCLRKLKRPEIQEFLVVRDLSLPIDAKLMTEAARAINDVPIPEAMNLLAELLDQEYCPKEMLTRAINACFRKGDFQSAVVVGNLAKRTSAPEKARIFALEALGDWTKPGPLDRVMGLPRPLPERPPETARNALQFVLEDLLRDPSEKIRIAAIRATRKAGYEEAAGLLFDFFKGTNVPPTTRAETLAALDDLNSTSIAEAVKLALNDASPVLRSEALKHLARLNPAEAGPLLAGLVQTNAETQMAQAAFAALGDLQTPAADTILSAQMDALTAGQVKAEVQLDLLEAARKHAAIGEKVKKYEQSLPANDGLAAYRMTLAGGNAERGNTIFHEREDVACLRCHAINRRGGTVGPDLAGVAVRHPREYLLESIVFPSKEIAAGFENVVITTTGGDVYVGMVKSEDENEVVLNSAEDGMVKVKKNMIKKRDRGMSPMPEGLANLLTRFELRDLVEYLGTLKTTGVKKVVKPKE